MLFNAVSLLIKLKCLFLQARNPSGHPSQSHEYTVPQLSRHTEDLSFLSSTCTPEASPTENLNRRQWSSILSRHQENS